ARGQNPQLEQAIAEYRNANYEGAITLLSDLAQQEDTDRNVRKESLEYLGRAYVSQRMENEAREAIRELLELEPPLVELDPGREPPPLMDLYYEIRKEIEGGYRVEGQSPGMKTIAIVDFTNNSVVEDRERLDPLQQGFASLLINQLSGATELKIIERERLQWLLSEQDLQRDARRVDQATAVQMGRLLGATNVLFGSFIQQGRNMVISVRLVDVETGEIMMTEQVSGRANQFFDLAEQLSMRVARSVNVSLEQTQLGARRDTRSLDAMMSYSEGLALLERRDYQSAYEKFLEALSYDPEYERARVKAESIKPLLT
ncbi:MAG: CsgG/HfaB family protein, partial [Rhodothermales bacterium]